MSPNSFLEKDMVAQQQKKTGSQNKTGIPYYPFG